MEELRQAIFTVLTTQFKKDMGGADKIVEDAGYLVRKGQGGYEVYNPKTQRCLYINGNYQKYIHYSWYGKNYAFYPDEGCKFDFVGALNKPFNKEWYDILDHRYETNPTRKKYEELAWAKKRIAWRQEDIKKAYKAIEAAQKELERAVRWEVEAKNDLKAVRAKLGLAK